MPPAQSCVYFAPLDKCLAGENCLISWRAAYQALSDLNGAAENSTLEAFLTDAESLKFLSYALNSFPERSSRTKADYETKIAPIHVSHSSNGDYNLEELKQDATWLSDKVGVDELVALRVVIIEWQQRAQDELLAITAGHGDVGVDTRTNFGASTLRASTVSLNASINGPVKTAIDFGKGEIRRRRQLRLFLEEKSHVLKIATELVNRVATRESNARTGRNWIDGLAEQVAARMGYSSDAIEQGAFCTSCIEHIESMMQKLNDNKKWPEVFLSDMFLSDDPGHIMFEASILTDITSALRLLLANLYLLQGIPDANAVSTWFKLMAQLDFFQSIIPGPALPNVEPLQALVSIISVSVLRIPEVINQIRDIGGQMLEGGVQYPRLDGQNAYFQNDACLRDLNLILYKAAQENVVLAAPATYGWSIITTSIRYYAKVLQDIREQQRAQHEEDSSDGELVSRRRASRRDSSYDMSKFEKQYQLLQDFELEGEAKEDPPIFLARSSLDQMAVFSVISQLAVVVASSFGSELEEVTSFLGRDALLELVGEGLTLVEYDSEVLEAVLSILSPDVHGRHTKLDVHLADTFVADDNVFRHSILDQALARYPYELSPLIRLLTALDSALSLRPAGSPYLVQLLEDLQTLAVMVPNHFRAYVLDHEDENVNSMLLTESLPLFVSKQALSFYGNDYLGRPALTVGSGEDAKSNVLAIPSGAVGLVVKESRPLVFKLDHPHSGLEYLGLLLSTILPNSELLNAPVERDLDRSKAAEIVTLINTLLNAALHQHQGTQEGRLVIERLGFALPNEQDIIHIVADILEMELLAHLDQSFQEGSLELLIACAHFFDALTKISPERVWPILSRSSLLGLAGGANALAAVVGGTEMQNGRFRFLGACVKMYTHLIDDAITGLVKRRARLNKTTNRFDSPMSYQDATPERIMRSVLGAYQTVVTDAWQSISEWRFAVPGEKSEITTLMLTAFERLITTAYGVGPGGQPGKSISALLMPSANVLLDTFVRSDNDTGLQAFGAVFAAGLALNDVALPYQERQFVVSQVSAAASFLKTLIRTMRMKDESQKPAFSLFAPLLKLMPTFASLFASDHALKSSLSAVLSEIVRAINTNDDFEPPSLLGQLSAEAGKCFLSVVSQLDGPLRDLETECAVWGFLSTVISNKQQWFAIYLLTGALPKDRLKDHSASKKKSLLSYALDQLTSISTMPPERAVAMLRFIASAQSAWVWATNEVRAHSDFLKNSLDWLNTLQPPSRAPNMAEETISANEHQMAAYLCNILAVNLHAALEIGDKTVLKLLLPKMAFLRQHADAVDAYNRSLHRNLSENFARKFPGCEVADFKRTAANAASLGRDFIYDLDLANRVLGHEMAWQGAGVNGRQQGFADEFARANVNLSLVEAQKALLRSWRTLSITLCESTDQDKDLQVALASTAEQCLRANAAANLEVPDMDDVINIRAEMAFVILSKLVAIIVENKSMKNLLPAAWDLVRTSPVDYEVATAAEDLRYYRTLLQILYLAIQPHVYMKSDATTPTTRQDRGRATDETRLVFLDPAVASCLVEIVSKVIAPGFRALCGNLHTSIDLATPGDFGLLTALLKALLSVPGIETVHPQLAKVIADSSLVRAALSLYSWADQSAVDSVYEEVSAMFLAALSTIWPVGEQMALMGG